MGTEGEWTTLLINDGRLNKLTYQSNERQTKTNQNRKPTEANQSSADCVNWSLQQQKHAKPMQTAEIPQIASIPQRKQA